MPEPPTTPEVMIKIDPLSIDRKKEKALNVEDDF